VIHPISLARNYYYSESLLDYISTETHGTTLALRLVEFGEFAE